METSYISIMASQTIPWAGKRGLRGQVAGFGARARAELDAQRIGLAIRAEVERAYVDLLLVRDQQGLLARLETLWTQSEGLARAPPTRQGRAHSRTSCAHNSNVGDSGSGVGRCKQRKSAGSRFSTGCAGVP